MFPLQATMFFSNNSVCLMDLCLPEESGVVFLSRTMRRDGGPPSIHHLISGQKKSGRLCAPVCRPCVDAIAFHRAVLCFVASTFPSLLRCVFHSDCDDVHTTHLHKMRGFSMLYVRWHAMHRTIPSSLTATSDFPNDTTEHEKGWSSSSSNRVE